MTVLDTNVLSEALKPKPSSAVMRWLSEQDSSGAFITAITQAEVFHGIESLAPGRRRAALLAAVEKMFAEEFSGRVLPFEESAARAFAVLVTARNRAGRPISQFDAMIAAIARVHGAALATRNAADFEGCGIRIVNPWTGPGSSSAVPPR